jgi:ribonuclease BN (tRNA processing enzyme)
MKLILLGTSGYHPSDDRQTACLMLPTSGLVLDAGTAMYRVCRHLATDELDIFVTHAHLDHVIGLTYLMDVLAVRPMRRITVHGRTDQLEAIDRHVFAEPLFPVRPPMTVRPLAGDVMRSDGGRVRHFALSHPGGAVGYRLDWPDRSMAYVTDTTASPEAAYVDRIRGVDLLVHECHFRDGMAEKARLTGHSCTTAVAEVARQADVGRLVLVHINPLATAEDPVGLDIARATFPQTDLGTDNMVVEF